MMQTQHDSFVCLRIDLFLDDMMVMLMKPNQYLPATLGPCFFNSFSNLSHVGVLSDIKRENHFFMYLAFFS